MPYMLFTDETNNQPSAEARFFIYGGIVLDVDKLADLHKHVSEIRRTYGFRDNEELKFSTRDCPQRLRPVHREAKNAVLEAAAGLDVKFLTSIVLHAICEEVGLQESVARGLNTVVGAFSKYLRLANSTGMCIIDRLPRDQVYELLKEKFQVGLRFTNRPPIRLGRVHMFATSCSGAVHANEVCDIILGAFRYCVNERREEALATGAWKDMFRLVHRMLWSGQVGERTTFREFGLNFRPLNVRSTAHQVEYDSLVAHLRRLIRDARR